MLSKKLPLHSERKYPSYLDTQNFSFKEGLKYILYHSKEIGRFLCKQYSDRNLTYLMYHSVADESKAEFVYPPCKISPELFESHVKHVVGHYDVLSIDEYLGFIGNKMNLPKRSLIISLDDGYLDNLETAIPILARYNAPAIIYLATRYIDNVEAQWVDRMYSMFKYRNTHHVTVDYFNKKDWNLSDRLEQKTLFSQLNQLLITKTYDERAPILEGLSHSLKFEASIPRLTLNWDEVKQISENHPFITLGIHTDQHLDVSTHKDKLHQELAISSNKLNSAINKKIEHFSFPYGRVFRGSHTLISEFGIKSAVCDPPIFEVKPQYRQYYIPRIDAVKYPLRQWWYIKK